MSRVDLPISDYVGDQTSVLDQAIRIIQASIDILTELGYLSSCLQMITLLQCVKSARWPTDYPLSIFPGVDVVASSYSKDEAPQSLQGLSKLSQAGFQKTVWLLHLPSMQVPRFLKAAAMLPNLKVGVKYITALSLTVTLNRLNPLTDREARIYAPHFPKPQSEGWFVILCSQASDEIIAIKRVGWSNGQGKKTGGPEAGSRPSARAVIKLPDGGSSASCGGRKIDVLVVSDGYLGMVYKIRGVELPDVPRVVNEGEKNGDADVEVDAGGGPA